MSDENDEPLIDEGGGEGGELWLVSYADLMTLVACFFIMMMAFANYDPPGFQRKMKEVTEHFKKDEIKLNQDKLEQLEKELKAVNEIKESVNISLKGDYLEVTFTGSVLFESGQSQIKNETAPILENMIDVIKNKDKRYRIVVEGHTDSKPIKSKIFPSNWELSSARSASVIHQFQKNGFDPKHLVAVGYSDTRPIAIEKNDKGEYISENLKLNRRVVIRILEPLELDKRLKLGLGQIYQDEIENPKPYDQQLLEKNNKELVPVPEGATPEPSEIPENSNETTIESVNSAEIPPSPTTP
jgi:chemotaxis protein MotB